MRFGVLGSLEVRRGDDLVDIGSGSERRILAALLVDTNARPQLDRGRDRPWSLHFHGPDEQLANGWAAGCAAGLALAVGSDLAGRLGVCAAPQCDRVFVDVSKNGQRRFCAPQCQSRVKAAAHRARRSAPE